MNRRSFFGWIGSALAGCVLAQTPLAGKWWEPEAKLTFAMVNDGEIVRWYINGKLVESKRIEPEKWYFGTIQDHGDWDMTPIMAVKS